MSTPVGNSAHFIDTQDVQVENVTDGLIYRQVLALNPAEIDHKVEINYLTNDSVEKLFSLTDAKFDVRLLVTEPEYLALVTLAIPVGAKLPLKTWKITMTSQSAGTTTLTGEASVATHRLIDSGIGTVELAFRLEFMSGATTQVITPT